MLRSAPNYTVESTSGALISKMDTSQHNRGWDLSVDKGILSVDLVNEAPRRRRNRRQRADKYGAHPKETFHYPTPTDLTAKDLAPNKPPKKADAKKEIAKKDSRSQMK